MEISGKVAVVTGAAAGIGRAIAARLGAEGATVVVADIDEEWGRETAAEIEGSGGRARFVKADVSSEEDVRSTIASAAELGGLDILVNNAGIGAVGGGAAPTHPEWHRGRDGNEGGLVRVGDTMFTESPNSDDAIATTANAAGAGSVRAGQLENSNVDIAREFVNLIEAQRGFQANSRVITTTDEILAELMNIVR